MTKKEFIKQIEDIPDDAVILIEKYAETSDGTSLPYDSEIIYITTAPQYFKGKKKIPAKIYIHS